MLCLTRLPGESILISDDIRVVISNVDGNRVLVSIDAPKEVRILREELIDRDEVRGRENPSFAQ